MFKQVERLVGVSSAWIEANSYFHQSLLKCLSSAAPSHFLFFKKFGNRGKKIMTLYYMVLPCGGAPHSVTFSIVYSVVRFRFTVFVLSFSMKIIRLARHGTAQEADVAGGRV